MNKKLAINGGKKSRTKPFPAQPGPDLDYLQLITPVLNNRVLSGYRGNATPAFYGGPYVQEFEEQLEKKFGGFAVACNSATSGIWMACAAIGLMPGDEVIVTPWSMSCSATIPLLFGAIPVFADIEEDKFCLDSKSVARKITPRTKAIIAVDLFGQPIDHLLVELAKAHNIFLIEDAAQAIGSIGYAEAEIIDNGTKMTGKRRNAGLLGDIGVFSFTQGKHLTAGEGGAVVTKDPILADKLALLRNHAEAVSHDDKNGYHRGNLRFNTVGLNLRMTEIQAAILIEELNRLPEYIKRRREVVSRIEKILVDFPLKVAPTRHGCTHSYYVLPFIHTDTGTVSTSKLAEAIRAELMPDAIRIDRGVPVAAGYIDPIYNFPPFHLETKHWAFLLKENKGHSGKYKKGTCPVAESLNENGFMLTLLHGLELSDSDIDDIENAFLKVLNYYYGGDDAGK